MSYIDPEDLLDCEIEQKKDYFNPTIIASCIFVVLVISAVLIAFTSCTLSFTNISTHGNAKRLVDEEQEPNISPATNLTSPLKGF